MMKMPQRRPPPFPCGPPKKEGDEEDEGDSKTRQPQIVGQSR